MVEGGMEGSPARRVQIQRRGHARFQVYLPARCNLKASDGRPLERLGVRKEMMP